MQTRADANRAKDELNNVMLHDNELKIGWGKGVAIPAAPLYTSTGSGTLDPAPLGASVPPPSALEAPPWGPPSVLPHTEAIDRGQHRSSLHLLGISSAIRALSGRSEA